MLADKIRALCESRGKAVGAVEAACGLSVGAISKWNASSPTVKNLKAVADYFDVTIDDLLREDTADAVH